MAIPLLDRSRLRQAGHRYFYMSDVPFGVLGGVDLPLVEAGEEEGVVPPDVLQLVRLVPQGLSPRILGSPIRLVYPCLHMNEKGGFMSYSSSGAEERVTRKGGLFFNEDEGNEGEW